MTLPKDLSTPGTSDSPPPSTPPNSSISSLWSDLFKNSSNSKKHSLPPVYLEDGTPVIKAPPAVVLRASEIWKDYVLCSFFGNVPPPQKIFRDLNPIWGRGGDITVHCFSEGSCLVKIPSVSTRNWVCENLLWSAGTVAFTAVMWTPSASLSHSTELTTAPVWILVKEIPPPLWTVECLEMIGGAVGTPVPNVKPSLSKTNLGTGRIRVIVDLQKPLPPMVAVEDDDGAMVKVSLSYSRLPQRCPACNRFGHAQHRCPSRTPTVKRVGVPPEVASLRSSQSALAASGSVQQVEGGASSLCQQLGQQLQHGPDKPNSQIITSNAIKPITEASNSQSGLEMDPGNPRQLDLLPNLNTHHHSPLLPLSPLPIASHDDDDKTVDPAASEYIPSINTSDPSSSVDLKQSEVTLLMAQTKVDLSTVFSSPQPTLPVNTHQCHSTPSTSAISSPSSPLSSHDEPHTQDFFLTANSSSKEKGEKSSFLSLLLQQETNASAPSRNSCSTKKDPHKELHTVHEPHNNIPSLIKDKIKELTLLHYEDEEEEEEGKEEGKENSPTFVQQPINPSIQQFIDDNQLQSSSSKRKAEKKRRKNLRQDAYNRSLELL